VGVAAFFDVDGTLIARNSAPLYVRHLRRTGQARRRDVAWTLYYLVQYKFGLLDIEATLQESMRFVAGKSEHAVRDDARAWYERDVRPWIYPQMAALVRAHREAGHVTALVTSATRYLAEPLAAELGVAHVLVTQLVVRDGLFTGEAVRPICYGEGKVAWTTRFAAEQGVDLGTSYFYTDSITDRPLLEAVGEPRIVNPDPPLRRLAQRRAWPILVPRLGDSTRLPLAAHPAGG
jgi:putative phosphoserine phosphatase/1-acylglycerol-3-phosphate O-acyltransferase